MNSQANGCIQFDETLNGDYEMSSRMQQNETFEDHPTAFPVLGKTDLDIIRIIGQHLNLAGFVHSCESLMQEAGCRLDHPSADEFKEHILEGDWEKADEDINELQLSLGDGKLAATEMKFLILEQKYLELLEEGCPLEGLNVLRKELSPMGHNIDRIHILSSYIMISNREELLQKTKWEGKGVESRTKLMDKLAQFLPPSVMLPPRRLYALLEQAVELQKRRCILHSTEASEQFEDFDLLTNHECPNRLPTETSQILTDHTNEVWCCQFSPDGMKLATGSKDATIIIWDVNPETMTCKMRRSLDGHSLGVAYISWSPDSIHLLACGPEDCSEVFIFNVETDEARIKVVNSSDDSLAWCGWHPSGQKFVTGGLKGQFYQCNLNGNLLDTWEGVRVNGFHYRSDGKTVLVADIRHQIRSYSFEDHSHSTIIKEEHPITSFTVDKSDRFALVNVATQSVHLWDLENKCLVRRLQGVTQGMYIIHGSFGGPNHELAASGSENCKVFIWNLSEEKPLAVLDGHTRCVNAVSWNPVYHEMMASVSDDTTVRIWVSGKPKPSNFYNCK